MAEIRLMLVDDHTLFRKGARALLETQPGCRVVAEASDGSDVLEQARRYTPDVIAMDIAMQGMDGIEATRVISRELPGTKVLILTMHGEDDMFYRALEAGASGYVLKESAPEELVTAVRAVAGGGYYITPSLTKRLVQRFLRSAASEEEYDYSGLSDRELEVLSLIGEGLTSREIAKELDLTVRTVQTHRTHIVQKLNLSSRADLMRSAIHFSFTADAVGDDERPPERT